MEHLSQYQTIINNIPLDNRAPTMSSSIQSVLSRANYKLKNLTKLVFPYVTNDSLLFDSESNRHKANNLLIKNGMKKRIQIQLYFDNRHLTGTSTNLIKTNNQIKSHLQLNLSNSSTRNKVNPYLSNTFSKEYSSSFHKTQCNQSYATKSTTITGKKKQIPKLCLSIYNEKMRQRQLEHNSTNKSIEGFMFYYPSPNPFSLHDSSVNRTMAQNKHKVFSSNLVKMECAVIERKCHSVNKAVRGYPYKTRLNKKKIDKLLNESNETINDLIDSKQVKIDQEHMQNNSVKTKRVLRETDWIHRMSPNIALEANKTLRAMFSIKPKAISTKENQGKKSKVSFKTKISEMDDLLTKNVIANKKCSEYYTKLSLS